MIWTVLSPLLMAPCAVSPFPAVEAVPLPAWQVAFEVHGEAAAAYHYNPLYRRPYVFPFIGPSGKRLTRMTHPHDPHGHGHHTSIWVSHQNVNGINFWENPELPRDEGPRIVHDRILGMEDGADSAALTVRNLWLNAGGAVVLTEERTMRLTQLDRDERYLDITLRLAADENGVTFGETPFGLLAVRVAKTMSVNDGGGTIRNSEGGVNEEAVFWQPARWVDYSGRVLPDVENGIAFFDHPGNVSFPTPYHVRNDGWMGASFSKAQARTIPAGESLELRYRLYAHGPGASPERIEQHWKRWALNRGQ